MSRYTPEARVWVGSLATAAVGLVVWCAGRFEIVPHDLAALAVLTVCAAAAHAFPIRSVFDGASIRLTNVFIVGAAIVLPPSLMPLIPLLAFTPDSWVRRHNPGVWVRWTFNTSQTVVVAILTALCARWAAGWQENDVLFMAGMIGAALLFTFLQSVLVGVVISLNSRIPLHRADTFTVSHLMGSSVYNMLGALVGGLWLARPILLVLILPLVVVSYLLSRSAHLTQLAQVDVKTGLHNFRHFEGLLEEELARSHRTQRPLSLLFADLDLLRQVNNTYGHLAGDKVLQQVATILTQVVRKGDVIARFGGEEFVVLLPGTDAEEATYLAERIREAVAAHPFLLDHGQSIRCTVSIGVASCPEDARNMSDLIRQADLAMYRAKENRNAVARVRVLPPVPRVSAPDKASASPAPAKPSWFSPASLSVWGTVAAGAGAVAWSLWAVAAEGLWLRLAPFLVLGICAEFIRIRVFESKQEHITLTFTVLVTMATVPVLPAGAALVSLVAALAHLLMYRAKSLEKALFNIANPPLSAVAAAGAYHLIASQSNGFDGWHLVAATVGMLVFHTVNFGLINVVISTHTRRPLLQLLRESSWYSPTKLFLGLTGAFLPTVYAMSGLTGLVMFAVPLLILRSTATLFARNSDKTITALQAAKNEVEEAHREKEEALRQLIETLATVVDARDNAVSGHSKQVSRYAVALGRELGLTPSELALIQTAALLHDMGKVGIPEAILNKPDRLTNEEYEIVKQHAVIGERIIGEVLPLADVARMVGEHHERFDGKGYPRGKSGDGITLGGRIIAVADTLDSILSDRPYSKGRGLTWALAEIERCSGTQFDPAVVKALARVVRSEGPDFFVNSAKLREMVS